MGKDITTTSNGNSTRLAWADMAKGIGMLCIIAGHMQIAVVNRMVYTFHVPIFFLLSGYFLSMKTDFKTYVSKRMKDLLIPYAFTSFLLILAKIPVNIIEGTPEDIPHEMRKVFVRALYGSGLTANKSFFGIKQIGAIWFLLALLWALIFVKYFIDKKYGWVWILAIAVVSYVTTQYFWLPWDIQAGGTAAVFVYVGAYLKKKNIKITFIWWLAAIGLLTFILEVIFDINVSMVSNYYKYTVVSIVGAILISYAVVCLSMLLERSTAFRKFLCFWGTNSIIALCYHLVELNNVEWSKIYGYFPDTPNSYLNVLIYVLKLILIAACTQITLKTGLKKIFGR